MLTGIIVIEALTYPEMNEAVANHQLDFVFTNPAHFVLLKMRGSLSAPFKWFLVRSARGSMSGI